jgi:hypothetical protein
VDIVADTYTELSIKTVERKKRGTSSKILIQSSKSKILRKFSQFLNNGKNKENILKIISSVIVENREKVLETLNSHQLLLSLKNKCLKVTVGSVSE